MKKKLWICLSTLVACSKPTPTSVSATAVKPEPSQPSKVEVVQTPAPPVMSEKKSELSTPTAQSPLQVIQSYTEELKSVAEIDEKKPAGKNVFREQKISKKVRNFFDFQELAKQSLGKHWVKTPVSKREEFSSLFTQLVENSYLKRSRNLMGTYAIEYKNETLNGNHAKVTSSITRQDANLDITYELLKKNDKWMIYNIVLDDVDLIRNYQSQFNRIIQKDGFNHLISMLRKKINSKDDTDAKL